MKYQVHRQVIRTEYGVIEADSHQQAADMLEAGLWGDCVQPSGARETIFYTVNGIPMRTPPLRTPPVKVKERRDDPRT